MRKLVPGSILILALSLTQAPRALSPADSSAPVKTARGVDRSFLDPSVKPCQDFFQYATGGWRATHSIPPAYPRWGTFDELALRNQKALRTILDKAAAESDAPKGSVVRRLGDFYAAAMDVKTADEAGIKPIKPLLDRIEGLKTKSELSRETAALQRVGGNVFFRVGSKQDAKDATKVIASVTQGGLGLPDQGYYLKDDPRSKAIRKAYVAHVTKVFQLIGDDAEKASAEAATVLNLETALAKVSMTRVQRRDPKATYHPMAVSDLQALAPGISWKAYLEALGLGSLKTLNVAQPDFFKGLNEQLAAVPLKDWKTYLRWHVASSAAPYLSTAFVQENFAFSKTFTGAKEILPRWRRAVSATNGALGEDLGRLYVKEYFRPDSKERVLAILHNIRATLREDLATLPWMGDSTRKQALAKLAKIEEKIGYPDKWRDYSSLVVDRSSYAGNVLRARTFEFQRDLDKIGKPVDRTEWQMTPPTVNAYYEPPMNEIVFPAGILQPPFFDPKRDEAFNYGAIGAVMGHEITHGFDDKGSQYDGEGNLHNWWSPEDLADFKARGEKIVAQADAFVVGGDQHLKGKLVEGEAIADLGGVTLAYKAYRRSLGGKEAPVIGGFTGDQRFFLGFASVWAQNIRPKFAHFLATVDPHPPARFRVNSTLANVPAFAKAFGCEGGCPMAYPEAKRAVIW